MAEDPTKREVISSDHRENSSSIEEQEFTDVEVAKSWSKEAGAGRATEAEKQKNPLAGLTKEELLADVEAFAQEKNLQHALDDLKRGALVAQDPKRFESLSELSDHEKDLLRREKTHKWKQPFMMYFMTSQ